MNLKKWIPTVAVAATIYLTACSATKARIGDNEDLFNGYSPEIQASIKSNRIQHGFDGTQVYLALGKADRTEFQGSQEIWYFQKKHTRTGKEEKSAGEYRDEMTAYENALRKGRKNLKEPTTFRTYRLYRLGVHRLVRFEDGVVVSWEEPDEMWVDDWHR